MIKFSHHYHQEHKNKKIIISIILDRNFLYYQDTIVDNEQKMFIFSIYRFLYLSLFNQSCLFMYLHK